MERNPRKTSAPDSRFNGIFHIDSRSDGSVFEVELNGRTQEITVFEGTFANILTDQHPVPCKALIVGRHPIKKDYHYECRGGDSSFFDPTEERQRYIIGITSCHGLEISEEQAELLPEALGAFIDGKIVEKEI